MAIKATTPCPFTKRELDCVKAFADGMTAKHIARKLKITPVAATHRVANAKARCSAATIAGLVAISIRNGWIE